MARVIDQLVEAKALNMEMKAKHERRSNQLRRIMEMLWHANERVTRRNVELIEEVVALRREVGRSRREAEKLEGQIRWCMGSLWDFERVIVADFDLRMLVGKQIRAISMLRACYIAIQSMLLSQPHLIHD